MEPDHNQSQVVTPRAAKLEIAHVLFTDIVGYSRLPMDQQTKLLRELQEIIRGTEEFREAQALDQLITLPTGDGMALVFFGSPEDPVQCAIQLSRALRTQPELKLRMGVHTGPVYRVSDINTQMNVAGGGINIAQRVMDCGDAGHILVSDEVAKILGQLSTWSEQLHDLGEAEVKHGVRVNIFNLYTDGVGNPELPEKFRPKTSPGAPKSEPATVSNTILRYKRSAVLALTVLIMAVASMYYFARPVSAINSIAVMPFVNESGNADVEYLSDGMTETLIKSLSNLPNLNVKPRSSVFRYKGKETNPQTIGKELNVQAILNGRVVQRGDALTLSLELVDVSKDSVIWTESYNRKQSEIVSLQSEIARDVSTNLKAKLSGAEEQKLTKPVSSDPEAYQAYLKGRYYWNRRTAENLKKAIEQFKIATDRDPNYALAFVGLADCYAVLNQYAGIPTSVTLPQARSYAERAISLNDQLAEPYATLGQVNSQSWNWAEAEKEYKRAIELNPNYATAYHWYSIFLKNVKRYDESATMIKHAQELDPLSSVISINITRMYQLQNNHQASVENSLKITELDPNFAAAYDFLGLSYLKLGRAKEAVAASKKSAELSNRAGINLADLGYVYAAAGNRAEAIAIIKELEDKFARKEANGGHIAAVYAGLGDKDKAFEWLEKDFQVRNGRLAEIRWTIPLDPLRDDARFKDLLKRMNLPE